MAQRWTDREIRYLESKYLNQPTQITADRLNRTMRSVVKKAMQLGLGKNNNILSANKLAECFNVTPKVVLRWIKQCNLQELSIGKPTPLGVGWIALLIYTLLCMFLLFSYTFCVILLLWKTNIDIQKQQYL